MMETKGKKIILASGSPRRKELLAGLNIDFEVDVMNHMILRLHTKEFLKFSLKESLMVFIENSGMTKS